MFFLIPWVPNMMVWTIFFPGKNLLFRFILTGCVNPLGTNVKFDLSHPVKMNLNKRFFPRKKSVQTIIFGTQGIRKTMN